MAVIEIARIQVRRGQENITGVPTLSPGEFGWAEDTEHLWIGKSVAEGATDNNNTRILTEGDLGSLTVSVTSSTYTYTGHVHNIGISNTVQRTFQSKLDDFVSVYDFGETGDGSASSGVYLQSAIDSLYLDSVVNASSFAAQGRVAIRIPAGKYNINNTIFLPPFVTLVGEGQGKTILNLVNSSTSLIQVCDGNGTSHEVFPSIQGGSLRPRNIALSGITFQYDTGTVTTNTLPLVRIDCAEDTYIVDCEFAGNYTTGASQSSDNGYTGLEIRGQSALTTEDLTIENCTFRNLYYGIKSNYDSEDMIVLNSKFRHLNRGLVYKENTVVGNAIGPIRTRLENNKFYDIEKEAWYVGSNNGTPTYHRSLFNTFKDVGNNGNLDPNPATPVINWLTLGNGSSGDYSSRFDFVNNTTTNIVSTVSWIVSGHASIEPQSVLSTNIVQSASPTTLVKLPFNGSEQSIRVDYNVLKLASNISRKGELLINASVLGVTPAAVVTDRFSYVGSNDGGLEFSATLNTATNTVVLGYTSTDAVGTITYKFSQLQ